MRTRVASFSGKLFCVTLIYSLLLTTLTPFTIRRAEAIPNEKSSPPSAARKPSGKGGKRSGELIVRFRREAAEQDKTALIESRGARRGKRLRGESGIEKIKLLEGQDVDALAAELRMSPTIELVEPNYLVSKDQVTPDDPRFPEQWALKNTGSTGGEPGADINAPAAWETTTGSPSIVIAVIDSGVDFSHPDLKNNQWTNAAERANNRDDDQNGFRDDLRGWDWVTDSGSVGDEQGHGTLIAGIIAAQGNNATGTSGVMWRAALMSLRVLDNTGTGDVANAVEAIDYAVANGAQVINCSWGTDEESSFLRDAIERAGRKGVVVVTSAGNEGRDLSLAPYYPASFKLSNLISVTSTDQFDRLASFSNYGSKLVSIAAPGTDILTTRTGGGYSLVTGTSASAAFVTGVAGLVKTLRPWLTAPGTRAAISDGARREDALKNSVSAGGVVSASGAIAALRGNGAPIDRGDGNNGNGGGGHQQPPVLPPSGRGSGGSGEDGGFSVDPPPPTGAPSQNLPDLDQVRKLKNTVLTAPSPIRANLPCSDCDPYGGGGGGGGYYPPSDPLFSTARTRPQNDTGEPGEDLGSRNFNWSAKLLALPGRAGLDLSLTLYYNSLVWTRDGAFIKYNADHGTPGPGFHLGMPFIQQRYYNSDVGVYAYMMVTPSGGTIEMRQVGASNVYESADSSYMQMIDYTSSALVRDKHGTQYIFSPINNELRCTQIKDRNGNYISVSYNGYGQVGTITDTLGRVVTFNYGADQNLSSITQAWGGGTHTWASFNYGQLYVQPNFPGLYINGPNYSYQTVLTSVTLDDGSYYGFEYTPFGQVWKITYYAPNAQALNVTAYNLPGSYYVGMSAQSDCPRFTERHDWALNWNNNNEVITTFNVAADNSWAQEMAPDGTIYKELFHTSGWQNGLTYQTEVWSGGVRKKWTTTAWTQDDIYVGYQVNPRPYDISSYDEAGNRRHIDIIYTSYGLPYEVREYSADGSGFGGFIRRTYRDYRFDQVYLDRHILGLISAIHIVDENNQYVTKLTFDYDWGNEYWQALPAAATQHDASGDHAGRGNLCSVVRWDVTDINNFNKISRSYIRYNRAGSVVRREDHYGHGTSIGYTDVFSDGTNRNTFAYPTSVTDDAGYTATTQYSYDIGEITRTQDPKGAAFSMQYDAAGRIERVTNLVNNAYTRYVYSSNNSLVAVFTTLQSGAGEAYDFTIYDGAGRVNGTGSELPGSAGGYRALYILYDAMGRVANQSNPTEITGGWVPAGDDAAGWVWTSQTYDWSGRPRVTTNPDGTTRENIYTGCGCAGGEQVITRDERGRRTRMTMDLMGRLRQVDELNWDQSVYSTTTYTYNARDQLTQINQAGQVRSFDYDGFGRLWHRTTPEQGTTTYIYNLDDTIYSVQDARGATRTFSYNNRHLPTSITYGAPAGVTPTANVSFGYDEVGNRTSMSDGLGSVSYVYNALSQLTSETRTFSGLGSYTLSYSYELGGQLSGITNPWGAQVGYTYDRTGRLTGVTGAGYAGVSSYASNLQYRASDAMKTVTYGNGRQLSIQYDNRLRVSRWDVSNVLGWNYSYNNFYDNAGRVTFAQNLYDPTLDRSYDYDHVGRVVSTHSGREARWHIGAEPYSGIDGPYSQDRGYDVFGNVIHRVGWGGWQGSGVDEWLSYSGNRLVTNPANGSPMQYDAAGNLTYDGYQSYQYDATGQQTYASWAALYQSYDGDRLRVRKSENGATTYYLRSSVLGGQVVAEISGGGGWQRGYVYYFSSQPLAIQYGGVYWVHQDPVAKSQRLTDASGSVVSWIELDPWGGETGRSANSALQPKKYTSYERDGNGGDEALMRRYEGRWNRFAQPDPADGSYDYADPQSFNRYAYVGNDPVNFVDPTGLYEACVHEAMTKFLAKLAGLSDAVASNLGRYAGSKSGGADSFKYAATNPINFIKGIFGKGPSADIHFASEAKLQEGIANFSGYMALGTDKGYQKAGFVLHSIQDVHGAHQGFRAPIGHAFKGSKPDRIIGDAKFMRAANETFQVLSGNKNASLTAQQVNDLINAIVAGCGKMAKKLQITRPALPGGGGGGGGDFGGGGGGFGGYPGWYYSMWAFADWVSSIRIERVTVRIIDDIAEEPEEELY